MRAHLASLLLASSLVACATDSTDGEVTSFQLRAVIEQSSCPRLSSIAVRTVYSDDGSISAQYVEGGGFTSLASVTEPDGEAHITVTRSLDATTIEQLELFLPRQDKTDREIVASAVQKRFRDGETSCSSLYIAKGWSR